jgi:hypothetical protein
MPKAVLVNGWLFAGKGVEVSGRIKREKFDREFKGGFGRQPTPCYPKRP